MFEQTKINQNSIINLLKMPERDNFDSGVKKPGGDFFSMVMEKTGYEVPKNSNSDKKDPVAQHQKKDDLNEKAVIDTKDKSLESSRTRGERERDKSISKEDKNGPEKTARDDKKTDSKEEVTSKELKKNNESSVKELKNKKSISKGSEEETGIIDQLASETGIKNLMDIIRAAFSGNKKGEEENLQKLFSSIKLMKDKSKPETAAPHDKNSIEKQHKNIQELLGAITKELKETVSKELFKNLEKRKFDGKPQLLSEKELKELAINIIEGMKKNKAKEIVKHEAKIASGDESKIDKKHVIAADQPLVKKSDSSDDSSFEKNGSKEKNSGRETFSYNGGKIDFSAKSGLDRMEHSLKMSDFKENLQEIIDKAKVTVRDARNGTFTLKLNPQELGNVNVNLVMENGVITGKFLVDNEDAKSMLLNNLHNLKQQLEGAGIAVGEFSVNVSDQKREFFDQNKDENLKTMIMNKSEKDLIAAADQYNSNTAASTGHINMVI